MSHVPHPCLACPGGPPKVKQEKGIDVPSQGEQSGREHGNKMPPVIVVSFDII